MRNTIGLVLVTVFLAGCPTRIVYDDGGSGGDGPGGSSGGASGKGGAGGKAGEPGTGGAANGGASATGGAAGSNTGGAPGTGGLGGRSTGGVTGTGGMTATGGVTGSGGMNATGGATGTGGVGGHPGTGGSATGGTPGTGGSGGACTPNKMRCNQLQPQTCDPTGSTWQNTGNACQYVCVNATGTCTGSCTPGSPGCSGSQPQMCDSNGVWQNVGTPCGTCHTCSASTGTCVAMANGLTCDDGQACTSPDSCQNGACVGSQILCNSPPACKLNTTCSAGACNYSQNVPDGTMDSKCGAGTPYCYAGGCVRCTGDTQCSGATPSCDTATHTCVCRRPSPGNRLTNPGFDGSFNGWTPYTAILTADSETCPQSNSVYVDNSEEDPLQCFPLASGTYFIGGRFFGGPASGSNMMRVYFFTGPNCTNSGATGNGSFDFVLTQGGYSSWTQVHDNFTAPPNTTSARIGFIGQQQYLDQLYINTVNQF